MIKSLDRFDNKQAKDYWKTQRARAGKVDAAEDPDALGNVCHAGAPLWLNQYYARHQREVFELMLSECPPPVAGARALDIGCGAGRWCRLLAARGYAVHGIDLQEHLIAADRARYPEMQFDCVSIQEFKPSAPFDLVTTVTVIQHIPFDEQKVAVAKIGSIVKPGGHVLILENIHDQGVHVFARSIDDWQKLFEAEGFRALSVQRYDYSPAIRAVGSVVGGARRLARRAGLVRESDGPPLPHGEPNGDSEGAPGSRLRNVARNASWLVRRAAQAIDDRLEPILIRRNIEVSTVHCGFLFVKAR